MLLTFVSTPAFPGGASGEAGRITFQGIGRAKIGMDIGELKQAYPGAKVVGPTQPNQCVETLSLILNGESLFQFTTTDVWDVAPYCEEPKDGLVVEWIYTMLPGFKTAEGIGPGTRVKEAVKVWGPATIVAPVDEETRWWVRFSQPPATKEAAIGFSVYPNTIKKTGVHKGVIDQVPAGAIIEGVSVGRIR